MKSLLKHFFTDNNNSLPFLYEHLLRRTVIPLFFMVTSPNWTLLLSYIIVQKKGSLAETFFFSSSGSGNIIAILKDAWSAVDWLDGECWAIVVGLFAWAGAMMLLLPGDRFHGPLTPKNFRPVYYRTAVAYYFLTMALVCPLIWFCSVAHLYYKFTTFTGVLIAAGSVITLLLYIKGLTLPSGGDREVTGNPVWDLFCGVELYPTAGPYISLKALVVCRFGLLLWQLVVLVAAKASYELSRGEVYWPVAAITLVQTVYLAKSFYWEDGYMASFDITFEHLGFYTGWGCIVILPTLYPLTSLYFVEHCPLTGYDRLTSVLSVFLGLALIASTYWADHQRQVTRATDGEGVLIWGRKPVLIRAKYVDQGGEERRSVLLASGFWAVGRHFNYTTEILIFLAIGLPALATSILPYLTFLFVEVVLAHRATRDDRKCSLKYGRYWEEYCSLVPYLLLPGIF